jgi:hypothetical protein
MAYTQGVCAHHVTEIQITTTRAYYMHTDNDNNVNIGPCFLLLYLINIFINLKLRNKNTPAHVDKQQVLNAMMEDFFLKRKSII